MLRLQPFDFLLVAQLQLFQLHFVVALFTLRTVRHVRIRRKQTGTYNQCITKKNTRSNQQQTTETRKKNLEALLAIGVICLLRLHLVLALLLNRRDGVRVLIRQVLHFLLIHLFDKCNKWLVVRAVAWKE